MEKKKKREWDSEVRGRDEKGMGWKRKRTGTPKL
jgi:hypothetical protein